MTILVSCGPSMSEVAGTYSGNYTYNGNTFSVAITLKEEGVYTKVTLKNGYNSSMEAGSFEIDGDEVILHASGSSGSSTRYTYSNGTLENNGHTFSK